MQLLEITQIMIKTNKIYKDLLKVPYSLIHHKIQTIHQQAVGGWLDC